MSSKYVLYMYYENITQSIQCRYLWGRGAYDYDSARACQDLLVGIDKSLLTSIKLEIINKLQSSELDSTSFRQNNDKLLWWCSWM
jgi:hypothetical protein